MSKFDTRLYLGFFRNELTNQLLSFWLPRCLDEENGGYVNCFSNDGSRLVSKDKYTWSQGRFIWTFAKLASMDGGTFTLAQREQFLALAKNGVDFLTKHVLIAPDDWRCIFLLNADGSPKYVDGYQELDMSISADCFVVGGFAKYAAVSGDEEAWRFAKKLNDSVWQRYWSDDYKSLPYPVSPRYQPHARPMILTNVCCEMYEAAQRFDPVYAFELRERIRKCSDDIFNVFMDENHLVHEFRYTAGDFPPDLFGQHINPGHVLEDMWFQTQARDILGCDLHRGDIEQIVRQTMKTGWDEEFGGVYHFVTCDGKPGMVGEVGEAKDEPQMKQVLNDWDSKLWWVHSEALYTTLLMYDRTGNEDYLEMFRRVFEYTFATFPNPDHEVREWIQIRTRDGQPQEKVVALPVKDPYHIIRNLILIIEALEKHLP